jgi:hypothetical protein
VKTGAGFGEPEDDSGRQPGVELLLRLTDALCALSCLEDAQGRLQFATVLGEQLHRQVDIRGVKLREDVVTLVRVALNEAGGERGLVGGVRIHEGTPAGGELDRLIAPAAPNSVLVAPPGPLSPHDEKTARVALAKGELPALRLRDDLVEELDAVLDLPATLSPEQLFAHVLEWNVQWDQLPPAVLLLDRAALLAVAPGHRAALTAWVDDWAGRVGLTTALERRRAERRTKTRDPDIPRCLIVAVEPTRDGSDEVAVRPWLNTAPGHWDPHPCEPTVTTLTGLGDAVQRALKQGSRLWSLPAETNPRGRQQPSLYIEFVLPYDLLNHDVAALTYRIGDGRPVPLGLKYGVHLRSLERMRSRDVEVREQWLRRWSTLRQHGIGVHSWREPDAQRFAAWQAELAGEASHTAVVLDAPVSASALEALKAAIAEGIGLAIWDRRGIFDEQRREVVTAVFAAVPTPVQIPTTIHRLRLNAETQPQGQGQGQGQGPAVLLGRNIGFFWDDPTRVVDIQTTDPGDPAGEEAAE